MIKKIYEYFFENINDEELKEALKILEESEKKLFLSMDKYDIVHSLKVYKGVRKINLNKIYLKLSLLHDIGKGKVNFLKRLLHKLGFRTNLKNHPLLGYEKLKKIDLDLAILVLKHHDKEVDEDMKKFQEVDNAN